MAAFFFSSFQYHFLLFHLFISVFSAEETSKFWHLVFVKSAFRSLFIHAVLQTYIVFKIPKFDQFISFATLLFTSYLNFFFNNYGFWP